MFNKFFKKIRLKKDIDKKPKPVDDIKPAAEPNKSPEPKPADEIKPTAEPKKSTEPKPAVEAKPKSVIAMVPIFSWRTLVVILIGFVLGILIALAYWIASPYLGSSTTTSTTGGGGGSTGLIGLLGIEPEGPYDSKVRIQVVSPGSEYIPLRNLQQMGEYYAAKAGSLPFMEFLAQELNHQIPGHTYDVDILSQMISTEYDYTSELPIIKITVIADTEDEAVSLAGLIPQNFRDYLKTEEEDKKQKEYESTVKEIETVKAALYEAQQDLNALTVNEAMDNDPEYIALKYKRDALQQLLDAQETQLIGQIIDDTDVQEQYKEAKRQLEDVTTRLELATEELLTLEEAETILVDEYPIIILNATISGLEAEIDKIMNGYTDTSGLNPVRVIGLAEMIATGDTYREDYRIRLKQVEELSKALSDAKKELSELQNQSQPGTSLNPDILIAQIKVDTYNAELLALQNEISQLFQQIIAEEQGNVEPDLQTSYTMTSLALAETNEELKKLESQFGYDHLAADLDYKIAQDKVTTLNSRLENLLQLLGSLVGGSEDIAESDYLVAGNPTTPSPILPERGRARNTLLMGAIAGIVIAWGLLNYKWIIKGMPSSSTSEPEGNGEK